MRYYEPDADRFVNQDSIRLWDGENLHQFGPNTQEWIDPLELLGTSVSALKNNNYPNNVADVHHISPSDNRGGGSSIKAAYRTCLMVFE